MEIFRVTDFWVMDYFQYLTMILGSQEGSCMIQHFVKGTVNQEICVALKSCDSVSF